MAKNQIIFLGAGASTAEGAPTQQNLLRDYFISYNKNRNNHKMDEELICFFRTFFNIDILNDNLQRINFPTLEEVLGILELSINRNESFIGFNNNSSFQRIQKIRDYLILLIGLILEEKLQIDISNHAVLVDKLIESGKLLNTAFISLNYDIIIDNCLIRLTPDYDIDYGVHFTNFNKSGDWKKPRKNKSIKLYKLHGSLNWLYCSCCNSLTLTAREKGVIKLKTKPDKCICPSCNSQTIPIIIPPTFFKVMSNYYLQQIWYCAERNLLNADRIIFCGYSFPDADMHIKYLLKRIEINKERTPEIIVVNNFEGKDEIVKENERIRYLRFFADKEKINYTNYSFEEFCVFNFNEISI